jgi:hypothetical protein
LWSLTATVQGKYLVVSDTPALMESVLSNFKRKSDRKPAQFLAGFNHQHEHSNFTRFAGLIDWPNGAAPNSESAQREPQFFSGNIASLSGTFAAVSAETVEIRADGGKVKQTVTYEWSQ